MKSKRTNRAVFSAVAVLSLTIAGAQCLGRMDRPAVESVSLHVAGALVLEVAFGSAPRGDAAGGER